MAFLEKLLRHPIPSEMPYFSKREIENKPRGVVCNPPKCVARSLETIIMKRNGIYSAGTKLQVEVRMPGLVRVGSYTRVQNGKPVKVRSYYRRSWEADVVDVRISTR